MTRMTRTIGSAEKLIAPSRSVIPMATLTWRCEAKPRFLQTHLGDKQRCTQKHLGRDRGTPERRVEILKALEHGNAVASQATASPSIRHERASSRLIASTISGYRGAQSWPSTR